MINPHYRARMKRGSAGFVKDRDTGRPYRRWSVWRARRWLALTLPLHGKRRRWKPKATAIFYARTEWANTVPSHAKQQ